MINGVIKCKRREQIEKSAVAAAFLMLYQTKRLEQLELLECQNFAEDSEPRLARAFAINFRLTLAQVQP